MQAVQIAGKPAAPKSSGSKPSRTQTPAAGQALIRIEASGVNFIDTYFREGRYKAELPYTLGQEAAGTIVAVAPTSPPFAPGDRVAWCGTPRHLRHPRRRPR